jgi:hypothetical protein
MHLSRSPYGLVIFCVLTFTLWPAACGDGQRRPAVAGKGTVYFACADQIVGVVPVDGTAPKDVYLCKGDTLTWQPNGHPFVVTFPKKYPFEGPPKIYTGSLVVYHYDMTVDNVAVTDPQVVGGGGHSN